jgi:hypothetical protein
MHPRPPRDEVIYSHQRMLMPVKLSQELEPNFLVVHALDKEMIKCFASWEQRVHGPLLQSP